nr:uncharacterized protein LOC104093656 isoform X1 [Nicotiana tomentosiformis]XP_033511357.1 uncharacterized protein LOC104093656 isoform X2 [Nicotiana tomentosiformis]
MALERRRLSLEWWTPVAGTDLASKRLELRWIKAFGIPLHAWSLDTFKTIGEFYGGYVEVDEDTKHISHLLWARICMRNTEAKTPEIRPAELFFQMHLLARRLTEGSGATSNLEPSTSPLRWILEAIHMNPSCLRYWRALLKFME